MMYGMEKKRIENPDNGTLRKNLIVIAITVILLALLATLLLYLELCRLLGCPSNSELRPTDKRMIAHFRQNEKTFNRLAQSMYGIYSADTFLFFPFPLQDENGNTGFSLPVDRDKERKVLMENIQIKDCYLANFNSVRFIYFYEGGPTKGFEFVLDRTNEYVYKKFVETETDLSDLIQRPDEYALYKKIDDHWNLFITR
ncbi:MAG: hypothetical protein LBE91_12380 [Tannerella sp.]|nr:hypothetical protein [Tannerella sp.]